MILAALALLVGVASAAIGSPCTTKADCGTEDYHACCAFQRGNGASSCIDTRYQKCCPNTYCNTYASCCNATCCNSRSNCVAANTVEGSVDVCTSIEKMSPGQSYTIYALPIILACGALIFFIFACVLIFVYKVRFTFPAVAVIIVSVLVFIFAFALLLSPHSMQAIFMCAVAALAIASLSSTSEPLAPTPVLSVTMIATTIAFLLIINPLHSNALFSFAPNYPFGSSAGDRGQGGILGSFLTAVSPAALVMSNNDNSALGFTSCTAYYGGYFRHDAGRYDTRLTDPSDIAEAFGLCGRAYLTWNLLCATLLAFLLPLLILALLARLLEVRGVGASWPAGTVVNAPAKGGRVHPHDDVVVTHTATHTVHNPASAPPYSPNQPVLSQ